MDSVRVGVWGREFGTEYDVPELIDALVAAGSLVDTSWHNDICPSFTLQTDAEDDWTRLWIEHADPTLREYRNAPRYTVNVPRAEFLYHGDDLADALTALFRTRIAPQVGDAR